MKPKRRTLWTVLMRSDPRTHQGIFIARKRGPGPSRVQSHPLEREMVEDYARSLGCAVRGPSEFFPNKAAIVAIVATYRSFDPQGHGRSASTFTKYTLYL